MVKTPHFLQFEKHTYIVCLPSNISDWEVARTMNS